MAILTARVTVDPAFNPAAEIIATVSRSVLDYGEGATFTLSTARDTFQYADGSWGVLSTGSDVVISGDAPASVDDANGYLMHGMENRAAIEEFGSSFGDQCFDEISGITNQSLVTNYTFAVPFNASENVAPSYTSTSHTLAAQDGEGAAVKVVRKNPTIIESGKIKNVEILEKIMVVSAVPAAPAVGTIRPPMWGTIDEPLRLSDADFSRVRAFALPSLPNTLADVLAYMQSPQLANVREGEARRCLCVGENYAQHIVNYWAVPASIYMLHSSTSDANRNALLAAFMVRAADTYGSFLMGKLERGGAGQSEVDHFCLALIAALCPAKSFLTTVSRQWLSNLNDQTRWAQAENEGRNTEFNSISGVGSSAKYNGQPMLPEHVALPYWISDSRAFALPSAVENSLGTARYRDQAVSMCAAGVTALGLIEGGWAAIWGDPATWDTSNDKYATLGHLDQEMTLNETDMRIFPTNRVFSYAVALWDTHRATFPEGGTAEPILAQPPYQLDLDNWETRGFFTETATGANYAYTGITDDASVFAGSNLPITLREMRMSHDGVQFAAPATVSTSGALAFTGNRYIQERRTNSAGTCPWSVNHSLYNGTTEALRAVLTGGTIPVATPTNTQAPKIYRYRYSDDTAYWLYDEQTGTMAAAKTKLIAGAGLYSDGVASLTYQWKVINNGGAAANVTGATSKIFDRNLFPDVLSTAGNTRVLRCDVTANDGNGNTVTTSSATVQMPLVVTITNDYSTDPNPVAVQGVGTTEWQSVAQTLRIFPNGSSFSGAYLPFVGLLIGVVYTFEVQVSGKSGTMIIDMEIENSIDSNTLTEAGVLTLTLTATTSTMNAWVRTRTAPAAGAYFDVTEIRAIPA